MHRKQSCRVCGALPTCPLYPSADGGSGKEGGSSITSPPLLGGGQVGVIVEGNQLSFYYKRRQDASTFHPTQTHP